jgi:hypothetical protein
MDSVVLACRAAWTAWWTVMVHSLCYKLSRFFPCGWKLVARSMEFGALRVAFNWNIMGAGGSGHRYFSRLEAPSQVPGPRLS